MLPSTVEIMALDGLQSGLPNVPSFLRSEPTSPSFVIGDLSRGVPCLLLFLPTHSVCWKGKGELYHDSLDG